MPTFPLLCAALLLCAPARAAETPAPPPDPARAKAPKAFDPAPFLADTRWHDGCYGVSLQEPKGMARDAALARWNLGVDGGDCSITANFILPPPRMDDRPPERLSITHSADQLKGSLHAGRGRIEDLPLLGRDGLVNKRPLRVFYCLQQPTAHLGRQGQTDAHLLGVAIVQVSPHCQLVLRLSRRIPAGAKQELPALVADARHRFEAVAGSVRTTPEALLAAARQAQVARGEKALSLLKDAAAALPKDLLLRVRKGDADIGWMRLEMRHQDAAWYRAHPPKANAADGLCSPGVMVRARTHMQDKAAKEAKTVDTAQEYFKADPAPMAPELRAALAARAADAARAHAKARGAPPQEIAAAVRDAAERAGKSDRFTHESWQRVVTVREAGKVAASSSELGFLAAPTGADPVARLRLEWAGSTPPELANFFSNPSWREQVDAQDRRLSGMRTDRDGGQDAPAGVPATAGGTDHAGALAGERKLAQWGMPLDQPCLAQAHLWLMPWLLQQGAAQSCAFFCYSPQAKQPGLCLFVVRPADDGSRDVVFRPAYDQPEQVFAFDAKGALRHIRLADGTLLQPTTVEELARVWRSELSLDAKTEATPATRPAPPTR